MLIKATTAAGAVVTVLGMGALGFTLAPEVTDWTSARHVQEASYASGAAAKGARASMPHWLPDGATQVRYRMSTTGGDRLLSAQLPDGRLPVGCTAGAPAGRAKLTAAWFPAGTTAVPVPATVAAAATVPTPATSAVPTPATSAAVTTVPATDRLSGTCGLYHVVLDGKQLYGWQDDADWVAAHRTGQQAG